MKGYLNTGRVARLINDVWRGLASGKLRFSPSPPPLASSDLRKDPEGVWNQALFMLRGMLRRPVSPVRISSKFHDVTHPKFPPDLPSRFTRVNHRFFLSVTYFPYFLPFSWCSEGRRRGLGRKISTDISTRILRPGTRDRSVIYA